MKIVFKRFLGLTLLLWGAFLLLAYEGNLQKACAQSVRSKEMITGMLQALNDEQSDRAEVMARELLQKYPRVREVSEAYYALGIVALRKEQFRNARKFLETYVTMGGVTTYRVQARRLLRLLLHDDHEGKPLALFLESERCLKNDRPLKSLRLLKECLAQYPRAAISADALNSLAYVYLVSLHNYEEAVATYRKLMQEHPEDSYADNALYGIARCLELLGQKNTARKFYGQLKKKHAALGVDLGGYSIPALNEYSRAWHRRASLGLKRLEQVSPSVGAGMSSKFFLTGFGDRLVVESPAGSKKYQRLWRLLERDQMPVRFIEFTLNRKVRVTWENRQELLSAASLGYAPVIIFQYFDEDLSPDFVQRNVAGYYAFIRQKLVPLLQGIPEPFILLEAEFNRGGVDQWAGWNAVAIKAINIIREELPSAKIGLTIGDWNFAGRENLEISMGKVAPYCDFLGYQIMISSVEENRIQDPPGQLLDRVLDFADYLRQKFNRPLLIGYMGISSLDGWEQIQAECLESFFRHRRDLMHLGVFGVVYFSYVDDPEKTGWFGPAERMFGLVDAEGERKPAWNVFLANAKEIMKEEGSIGLEKAPLACPLQVSPSPANPVHFRHEFQRPRCWRLTILGKKSGASRTYQGFSQSVHVSWKGHADKGRFAVEPCQGILSILPGREKISFPLKIKECNFSVVRLMQSHRKILFAEGRSSDLLDSKTFVRRSSKAYSGFYDMHMKWGTATKGTTFFIPCKKTLLMRQGDALVLRFKEVDVASSKVSVNVLTEFGSIPFSIVPALYRDAGKGWRNLRIYNRDIVLGLLWKYDKSVASVHLKGLAFRSLSQGQIQVDDVAVEQARQGVSTKVIPYISLPPNFLEPKTHEEDPGHIRFFPQR